MSDGAWCTVLAPAKVNLFLEVVARRPDGYHELETLMLAIDLCDRVRVRLGGRPGVRCALSGEQRSNDVPSDERNLAVRAALAALQLGRSAGVVGADVGLELELEKRIPSQAGLGGASSDAAAAFAAVERALGWSADERLAERALASLGSDCVFFRAAAESGVARCTGRGERVEPWPAAKGGLALVVITPDLGASTALVYQRLGDPLSWRAQARSLAQRFEAETWPEAVLRDSAKPFNRLEEAACSALPRLAEWRAALHAAGPVPLTLSGSGASFFALFDSLTRASEAREEWLRGLRLRGFEPRGAWAVRAFRSPI